MVRENIQLRDRTQTLQEQVEAQAGREQAVQDALVTAQELRKDMREQSQREAEHIMREAESVVRAGVQSTPSFVIDGALLAGAVPIEGWRPILDSIYAAKAAK